jgi:hypothetical protein
MRGNFFRSWASLNICGVKKEKLNEEEDSANLYSKTGKN